MARAPNYFQRDTLRPYVPTPRDRMANWFTQVTGDNRFSAEMARRLFGSSGVGNTGLGVVDFIPGLGTALQLDEAGAQMTGGHPLAGAGSAALAAVPIAGPAVKAGARRVAGAAAKAGNRVIRELAPKAEEAVQGFTAYHGSPHTFDQFDASKIGTGEGAQAYGHGLYFAENEAVAKAYRDALKWRGTDWHDPEYVASYWMQNRGSPQAAKQWLQAAARSAEKHPNNHTDELANKAVLDAIDLIDNGYTGAKQSANPGSMYQVRIKADPNDFLDWDKPLSEQSPKVQEVLGGIYDPTDTGERIVRTSVNDARDVAIMRGDNANTTLPGAQAAASRGLGDLGIPGIKYLDQGSRGAGEGSRNFVVFDPRIVDIMKRYGVTATVASGILAGSIQPPNPFGSQ